MPWIHKTRITFSHIYNFWYIGNDHLLHPGCDEYFFVKNKRTVGCKVSGGEYATRYTKIPNCIPHIPSYLPVNILLKPDQTCPNGFKQLQVKKQNNIQWIYLLHQNHTYYSDIMIDHNVINSLPESYAKAKISYHLLIHALTAEYEHMTEVEKITGDNDDISRSLDFGS